jgi:hypothetical protein
MLFPAQKQHPAIGHNTILLLKHLEEVCVPAISERSFSIGLMAFD